MADSHSSKAANIPTQPDPFRAQAEHGNAAQAGAPDSR